MSGRSWLRSPFDQAQGEREGARAVDPPTAGRPAHLRNRIVVYGNKTVVFD